MSNTLTILFKKSRNTLLHQITDVGEEHARIVPEGCSNHILWHAGHAYVLVERSVYIATNGWEQLPPLIPDGWWDMFGWLSKPDQIANDAWPALAEVQKQLTEQYNRISNFLSSTDETFLSSEMPNNGEERWSDKPKREVIVHGFYDEIFHAGQIAVTKKLLPHD